MAFGKDDLPPSPSSIPNSTHAEPGHRRSRRRQSRPRILSLNLLSFHKQRHNDSNHSYLTTQDPYLKSEECKCLRNLSTYRPQKWARRTLKDVENSLLSLNHQSALSLNNFAAVLVALFIGRHGDTYVLLSQRSQSLRSYAGDTSLPGGKVERGDRSIEDVARREAYEEIGLPMDKLKVPLLCILEPFVAKEQTIVFPVVVLITDKTLRPILNRTEVSSLFSHPLQSFLSTTAPSPPKLRRSASKSDSEDEYADVEALAVSEYYSYNDIPWFGWRRTRPTSSPTSNETVPVGFSTRPPSGDGSGSGNTHKRMKGSEVYQGKRMIRMHRFLTGREAGGVKPVFGLTAAILVRVATIGYNRRPEFDVEAKGQPSLEVRVGRVLEQLRAEERELRRDECREPHRKEKSPDAGRGRTVEIRKEIKSRL